MSPYRDLAGGGAILGYSRGPRQISITFRGGQTYLYTYASAGHAHVEEMKRLASVGCGLHGYLQYNRPQHEDKR